MEIREIVAEDLPRLVKLYIAAFNCEPWYDKWTEKTAAKRLSDMMSCPNFFGLAAFEDGEAIALAMGNSEQYFDGVGFSIKELCVKKERRGEGIGTKLLSELEALLKAQGIRFINLCTVVDDEDFYKKSGFRRSSDMISMGKEL